MLTAYAFLDSIPDTFIAGRELTIREGSSIRAIGEQLETEGFIRSSNLFRLLVRNRYKNETIQAGIHRFDTPLGPHELIETLFRGDAIIPLRVVTFPEGFTIYDVRTYLGDAILQINIEQAIPYEGQLFPDTYFVAPHETFEELVERMRDEYEATIAPLRDRIEASGFTEHDVIVLASILEREANDETSMRMVSGILQNRLRDDLPLQVDAVFEYVLGKTSAELTVDDLAIDSPYNTYTRRGLPPTPIANPGLMAIEAVLNPTPSDNYYYLTGEDGSFYYAKAFEEHKRNKARYLR
jgi:UPF0755 protein